MLAEERDVPGDLLVDLEVEERAALDVERHRLRPVGREVVVGVAARGGGYEMSAGRRRESAGGKRTATGTYLVDSMSHLQEGELKKESRDVSTWASAETAARRRTTSDRGS